MIRYGDRRHWQADIGRFNTTRWCSGAPCHLPGVAVRRHWVKVMIWRRSESARFDN